MKKYKTIIILVLCILIAFAIFFICKDKVSNHLLKMIDERLDYERALEVGDEFNKLVWEDCTFQINHYASGNDLDYVKNEEKITLLSAIKNYKISSGKLYVIAEEGYAVIGSDNMARICLVSGDKVNLPNVTYISSYEEFGKEEREIMDRMKK